MTEPHAHAATWASGIAAITLFVADLVVAKDFYRRVFDLDLVFEDSNSAVFALGGTLVNLLHEDAAPELIDPARVAEIAAGHRSVFTIRVDDVDALVRRFEAEGVTLLNGPIDRSWGPRTVSFCDPSGHIWEIAS